MSPLGHQGAGGEVATIVDILDRAAQRWPQRTALVDGERRYDYAHLRTEAIGFASGLVDRGIRPGDRVCLWMPNGAEWLISFFGAVYAGAVVVPLNTVLSGREITYQVGQAGARMLIVSALFRNRRYDREAASVLGALDQEVTLVCLGETDVEEATGWNEVAAAGPAPELPDVKVSDPVLMLYTSGTTGRPKGAVHSHHFVATQLSAARHLQVSEEDCVVLYLPLFHILGLASGALMMLASGARVVLMARFDAAESLRLMETEGATAIIGIPTTYLDQLNTPLLDEIDLRAVRFAITSLPYDLCLRVRERFGVTCVNPYGMTETAGLVTVADLDDPIEIAVGTIGRVVGDMEARIVDGPTGDVVPVGVEGILSMRGPSILTEYDGLPEATAAVLSDDGWFNTGDVASMDADGNIYFVGRKGDTYRVGGELVDPVEVETALQSHAAVIRAAALGVPDERLGQVGHVWVQTNPDSSASADELQAHARAHLAAFKVPRVVHFVDDLPTTASGKVQKYRLLEEAVGSVPG